MVEEQCGFRKGRSFTDAIYTVQQIMEKRKEHNLPLFLLFIGYEKAYDKVNRDKLWEMMKNKSPNYLLNKIKCIYRNRKIRIKFNDGISEPIHINKAVRQGCGLSPVLFNVYINKIIQEFKTVIKKGIQLNNRKLVNTILYADDQILMATSDDDLQTMAHNLNLIARKYKMTISSTKTKSMEMWGNNIQRVKIVISDNIIEQVTDFKYFGYRISEYGSDLQDKLQIYNKINGAIRRHFKKQMNKETKLRIQNITAKAALKFGSEAWVLKKREVRSLKSTQMQFLGQLFGITKLDKEMNQCIRQKTGAQNIVKEIKQYQKKWLQHVQRIDTNRLPKQAQYKPKVRRNIGRPRKRWRDQLHLEDQETGNTPNPSGT